ncbi:hypothetical protein SLEP1_g46574 [Rubroshorea leprosula]|uniref:Uncharacterized protein n=1 Tax=Rubroshorea leprosula TaxID=152421 RepID=A0AAV5LMP1_9ROSI|nr:hypothetical protein SLEP1_g46574 [Rubroshorea leprosula]
MFSTPSRQNKHAGVPRGTLFLSTIWLLWKARNALAFEAHKFRPHELCARILQQAQYTMIAMSPESSIRLQQP